MSHSLVDINMLTHVSLTPVHVVFRGVGYYKETWHYDGVYSTSSVKK